MAQTKPTNNMSILKITYIITITDNHAHNAHQELK